MLEEGRRQRAEGKIAGGLRPANNLIPSNQGLTGVLNPYSSGCRRGQEAGFPSASCLLPSAFLDNISRQILSHLRLLAMQHLDRSILNCPHFRFFDVELLSNLFGCQLVHTTQTKT